MANFSDKKILDSWKKNAIPWAKAVREHQIQSRETVTNEAIVSEVLSYSPAQLLDIGCGEGWLARSLSTNGISVTGIDATGELISNARNSGGGKFHVLEYEKLSSNTVESKFDLAVCNFSLLGKESVEHIFRVVPSLLNDKGYFIIQTLHPTENCGESEYIDSWLEGSWDGFSKEFIDPAPWYFRTLESWVSLYEDNGFELIKIEEPTYPETGALASLLMVGRI